MIDSTISFFHFLYITLTVGLPIISIERSISMPKARLTKNSVDNLRTDAAESIFWDESLPGFGVRVKTSGVKSYVVQYRNRQTGRSRRKTLGKHGPHMSLYQARELAKGYLSDVVRGGDPVAEFKAVRSSPSVRELADQYMSHHAIPKKRPRSVNNDRSMLKRIILPEIGNHKIFEVEYSDIQALHNSLKSTPYQANRVLSLVSKMFELSIKWKLRRDNPAKGIEKFHEEKRHRWLSNEELKKLTKALDEHPNQIAANAIRLQLLTGARIGEVLSAKWADFNLERGVWIKPSHHTKQKRTEHLPLSGAAKELLILHREATDLESDFVFPGRLAGKPIVDLKRFWRSVMASAGIDNYRIHDNRHTHASQLVSSGMSLAIVGRLLGHTNPMTTQRYAHLADDPLREAAEIMAKKMS